MTEKQSKLEKAQLAHRDFLESFKTLQLATIDKEGLPDASYSPYVKIENDFYVYVSELATHTYGLITNNDAAVFFVQNEDEAKHLFVRRRLSYKCKVAEVSRGSDLFESTLDSFEEKFGKKFISMLRGLEDFHLVKLTPNSGTFVNGFGQAYNLSGDGMNTLSHKNDVGHRSSSAKTEKEMKALAD